MSNNADNITQFVGYTTTSVMTILKCTFYPCSLHEIEFVIKFVTG